MIRRTFFPPLGGVNLIMSSYHKSQYDSTLDIYHYKALGSKYWALSNNAIFNTIQKLKRRYQIFAEQSKVAWEWGSFGDSFLCFAVETRGLIDTVVDKFMYALAQELNSVTTYYCPAEMLYAYAGSTSADKETLVAYSVEYMFYPEGERNMLEDTVLVKPIVFGTKLAEKIAWGDVYHSRQQIDMRHWITRYEITPKTYEDREPFGLVELKNFTRFLDDDRNPIKKKPVLTMYKYMVFKDGMWRLLDYTESVPLKERKIKKMEKGEVDVKVDTCSWSD